MNPEPKRAEENEENELDQMRNFIDDLQSLRRMKPDELTGYVESQGINVEASQSKLLEEILRRFG